ncbi:MFS transporter [Dictyobacter arantiisoli]|uniref:Tetracycline efflux MFS transporter TetA(P) n=1 Tax=Dictyobacter arantiisoli TaxID=2014874 RepID=A0A5A5T6A3_9CHLR|nr:MFS transporter [Dictyobacter arantiisoli]GCF06716.1 tetracycline efflux MFS transporter TetA(P) [Dictyobacter arantiisoli]
MHSKHSKFNAFTVYLWIAGLGAFAQSIIFTLSMVYQIETVKLNPLQLVLVGTTLETACFISQVPTGILADMYSRRLAVIVGYLLMGLGFLLEGMLPTFFVMLLAQILWGCGATCVSGAEEAWCASEIGEERVGAAFLRSSQLGMLASLLGIPLGIGLGLLRLNLPIVVGGVVFILLALFLFFWMPERNFQPAPHTERSSWRAMGQLMADGGQAVRRSRMLLTILCITAFVGMASEGFDRLQTDHFIQDFAFPSFFHLPQLIWFGIIAEGSHLLCLTATELVRRCVNTNNQTLVIRVMSGLQILLIGSIIVFALTDNFYLALLSFWCASIGRRADAPLYNTWIVQNSEPRIRATVISMFGQVDAIGQIVGGPGIGYLGSAPSLRAALLATSAILTPNLIFFARALGISKTAPIYAIEESAVSIAETVLDATGLDVS